MSSMTDRFRELHLDGTFVLPNPWDIGSARILASLGAPALATTSSGLAATLGEFDQTLTFDQLLAHSEDLVAAIDVPLNLDSERCFGTTPAEVTANVARMGETGAAGCSIEDYDPDSGSIDSIELATERVAAAAAGAEASGMVLTARTENHLYGVDELDDTIARLVAFVGAGAEAVYAPGLVDPGHIKRVVDETGAPVNVLTFPGCPDVPALAELGVRRVSTGGALLRRAHGALVEAGRELLGPGTLGFLDGVISPADLESAFD